MSHALRLVWGALSVDLNSGASSVMLEYVPQSPDISTIDTNSILQDGGERPLITRRNVTETARILITGSSQDDIQDEKQRIQRYFTRAERYQETKAGSPMYVHYTPHGVTTGSFRSEILTGKIDLFDRSLDWRWTNSKKSEMVLSWTRRYFWEGAEITASIYNRHTTGSIVRVYNTSTSTRDNFVDIDASVVTGEIPTPATILMQNPGGFTINFTRMFIAHNSISRPSAFDHWIEAEAGSAMSGITASVKSTTASLASDTGYVFFSTACNSQTQTAIARWLCSSTMMDSGRGGNISAIGIFWERHSASMYGQMKMMFPNTTGTQFLVAEGPEIELFSGSNQEYIAKEFGVFKFPPNLQQLTGHDETVLQLYIRNGFSSTACTNWDAIFLAPVDTGYRIISSQHGQNISASYYLVLDESNGNCYVSGSSNYLNNITRAQSLTGKPIMLQPYEDQRISFLHHYRVNTEYLPNNMLFITVKFRPRKLTI